MMVRLKGKIMTINYNQKGKHNDHEATHSHTLSLMWLKKKTFLVEIQYSEVPIENNYQNMLRSTHAEFCAKKLRNREGDLKLAGSPSLYHQTFGLLWTKIIFDSFGWTVNLSREKHPLCHKGGSLNCYACLWRHASQVLKKNTLLFLRSTFTITSAMDFT